MAPEPIVLSEQEETELRTACQQQLVDEVPTRLHELPSEGSKLEIHSGGQFPDRDCYTQSRENNAGNENHFQGCQRLPGHYVAVSGGDWRHASSHLFVGHLTSRAGRKRWGTNVVSGRPPDSDRIIARLDLDNTMWHAGGISLCGYVLAVPVECGGGAIRGVRGVKPPKCDPPRSRIFLVDVRNPAAPQVLARHIHRDGRMATAAALTWTPGGGYLLAVLRSATKQEQAAEQPKQQYRDKRIEFYRTSGNAICGDFEETAPFLVPKNLKWEDYQTINFIREAPSAGNAEGRSYLCGMAGNAVHLFEVTLPGAPTAAPSLRFVTVRPDLALDRRYAEFKAGVGTYAEGGTLALYAVPQWRRLDGRLGLTEWAR